MRTARPHANRLFVAALLATAVAGTASCGGEPIPPPPCPKVEPPVAAATVTAPPPAAPAPPTVDEARAFLKDVDADLRKLVVRSSKASWVNENFITDDSQDMSAATDEALMEYLARTIKAAARFDALTLPDDLARQMKLLKIQNNIIGTLPSPVDPAERAALAKIAVDMKSAYGKGKYCPDRLKNDPKAKKKCLDLQDLSNILEKSRKWDELVDAWKGWHAIGAPMRPMYEKYVELGNKGAQAIGFKDMSALWKSGYDMTPEEFEAETERLWAQVKPLYDELHCYARARLRKEYGKDKIGDKAPIPANVLGNMWAQTWDNMFDQLAPYKDAKATDVTKKIKAKKLTPKDMVKIGEGFFTSLGLDPLPPTFWERSLFTKPADREVVCHASAWDVTYDDDLRIKMCIEPKEEDLFGIHHELGHDY